MIRQTLAAAALLASSTIAAPLSAQSEQEQLDTRYDRALAAGYKALMLCSAIANAERNGPKRTPESVEQWELAGIQAPLDTTAPELPYQIARRAPNNTESELSHVWVEWAEGMAPRIARHESRRGCELLPIGGSMPPAAALRAPKIAPAGRILSFPTGPLATTARAAFGDEFGEGARTTAVTILSGGELLGEAYAPDFGPAVPQRTWSVAKSIAASLVGAAVERGEIAVKDRAGLGYPGEYRGRGTITLDHLLRMASGRYSDTPGTAPIRFIGVGPRWTSAPRTGP